MPTYKRKTMCHECPFRACAPRGWLGPMTVDDLESTIHGPEMAPGVHVGDLGVMICHVSIDELRRQGVTDDAETEEKGQYCVGAARYANSVLKSAHNHELHAFQQALKSVPDQPLITPFKLREYHTLRSQRQSPSPPASPSHPRSARKPRAARPSRRRSKSR